MQRNERGLSLFGGFPDVEQDLEVELLAAIGEVERRHLRVVASGLGALEGFAIHRLQVFHNTVARAGHTGSLECAGSEPGKIIGSLCFSRGLVHQELARGVEQISARGGVGHGQKLSARLRRRILTGKRETGMGTWETERAGRGAGKGNGSWELTISYPIPHSPFPFPPSRFPMSHSLFPKSLGRSS